MKNIFLSKNVLHNYSRRHEILSACLSTFVHHLENDPQFRISFSIFQENFGLSIIHPYNFRFSFLVFHLSYANI